MEELLDLRAVDRLPKDGLRIVHACRKGVEFASFEYVDRKRGEIGYSSPMLDNDTGRALYLLDVSQLKLDETITLAYDEAYARGLDARYVWVALGSPTNIRVWLSDGSDAMFNSVHPYYDRLKLLPRIVPTA